MNETVTKMAKTRHNKSRGQNKSAALQGPSLYEVEYLRQMKEEWELYLKTHNFSTIVAFELVFRGADYHGSLKVTA